DIALVKEINENYAQIEKALQNAETVFSTLDASYKESLNKISSLYTQWKTNYADKQMLYMQRPETINMARAIELSKHTQDLLEDIHNEFTGLAKMLDDIYIAQEKASEAAMGYVVIAVIAGSVFLLL